MGFLDGLLGNVLGMARSDTTTGAGTGAGSGMLVAAALQLLQQNGGLEGLLGRLRQSGLGAQADSWVSTGQNLPVDADAICNALGNGPIGEIAQRLGVSNRDLAGGLANVLPGLVDRMTPHGTVPAEANDVISKALANLQGRTP